MVNESVDEMCGDCRIIVCFMTIIAFNVKNHLNTAVPLISDCPSSTVRPPMAVIADELRNTRKTGPDFNSCQWVF